jgi:uncharacterized membrane protein YfcA
MSLELFTAIGALVGGSIAFLIDERLLSVVFAALLGYVAFSMARGAGRDTDGDGEGESDADHAAHDTRGSTLPAASLPAAEAAVVGSRAAFLASLSGPEYQVRNLGTGIVGAAGAGVASALLGIGGGTVKVPLMHLSMGVPLRVATATSNLMIGITASTSAIVYLLRGGIDPYAAGPAALGVFLGASLGSRAAHRVDVRLLRLLFVVVLLYTAFEMLQRAIGAS